MNQLKFAEAIKLLTETFGDAVIKGNRLNSIKKFCERRISDEGFIEVCGTITENFRQMPLPSDVEKGISEWRKRYQTEHGKPYGYESSARGDDGIECETCFDTGILKIKHHEPDNFAQVMRCDCKTGKASLVKIPAWDQSLRSAFARVAIDPKFFNPGIAEGESQESAELKLWKKVEEWKSILRKSEIYWQNLGYKGG